MKIGIAGLSGMSVFMTCDHFHAEGETIAAQSLQREPGGKGYNQAIAARRLGAQVLYGSACGDDLEGQQCRQTLEQEKIDALWQFVDHPTGFAHILTDRSGRNRVTVYRGASNFLAASFIRSQKHRWQECDLFLLGLECPLPVLNEFLTLGEEAGIPVLLNPAPAVPLDPAFLQRFSLLTPNEQEAATLLQISPDQCTSYGLAQAFLRQNYHRVVVTLGHRGALVVENQHAALFPALSVPVVDTTGAGDCFNAALAVSLAKKMPLYQAVEYAINASAYSVQFPGVLGSLPTEAALACALQTIAPTILF